jgi:hypothetical protein
MYPGFLWALLLLTVPIIIHLFSFRKFKKVYFSNIRFLQTVQLQSQSKSRIRHFIILLSRMLIFTFLVLAFARPYIAAEGNVKPREKTAVSVYIDNSFSMNTLSSTGLLLDLATEQAIKLAGQYDENDKFQLLTNDLEGYRDRFVSKNEFIRQVKELTISPASRPLSQIISRQQDLLASSELRGKAAYIITDLQESAIDVAECTEPEFPVNIIPIARQSQDNLYVDSVWFQAPVRQSGAQEELHIRVANTSAEPIENMRITLNVSGNTKIGSLNIAPKSTGEAVIGYSNTDKKDHKLSIWLEAGEEQPGFDDTMYLAYNVRNSISILVLNEPGIEDFITRAFGKDDFFKVTTQDIRQFDPSEIMNYDLVVMNSVNEPGSGISEVIKNYTYAGGTVFLFPGITANIGSWNLLHRELDLPVITGTDTSSMSVASINLEHSVFKGVTANNTQKISLPVARKKYPTVRSVNTAEEILMTLRDGTSFLSQFKRGRGLIFRCTVPAAAGGGNFIRHAFFVTTLIRAAELSNRGNPLYITIGAEQALNIRTPVNAAETDYRIQKSGTANSFIPLAKVRTDGTTDLFTAASSGITLIHKAGIWEVKSAGEHSFSFGANYNRQESELNPINREDLVQKLVASGIENIRVAQTIYSDNETGNQVFNKDTEYWKLCLIFALGFILIETILLRLWKV